MVEREKIIRLWFDMWLQRKDLGILDIFSDDALYIESWGPQYSGAVKVKHWFDEWNTRGTVLQWDIKQYFNKEDQTIVMDIRGKLGNLPLDSNWENHPVCFERTNGIEAFC